MNVFGCFYCETIFYFLKTMAIYHEVRQFPSTFDGKRSMKFIEAVSTPAEVCGEPRASPHQARLDDLLSPRLSGSFLLYNKLAPQTAQTEARRMRLPY